MWQTLAGFCSSNFFVLALTRLPPLLVWPLLLLALILLATSYLLRKRCHLPLNPFKEHWFPRPEFWLAPWQLSVLLFLGAFFVGAGVCQWRTSKDVAAQLPETLNSRTCTVQGEVLGLPVQADGHTRFQFDIAQMRCGNSDFDGNANAVDWQGMVRLNWYDHHPQGQNPVVADGKEKAKPLAGERWQLCVRLKRPHGFASPGARDQEAHMLRQGVMATGYVVTNAKVPFACDNQRQGPSDSYRAGIARWREQLSHWLAHHLADQPSLALVQGLLVGDSRGLSKEQWQLFRATGTVHLLVISGLHIGLVALFVCTLVRLLGWLGCLPLGRIPEPMLAVTAGVLASWGYGVMAGFGVPVQRALIALSVGAVTLLLGFRLPLGTVFLLALTVVLAVNPWALTGAGFWLSFGAVAGLLYLFAYRLGEGRMNRWLLAQALMTCLLLPIMAAMDQPVSVWSPLVNLISIPLIGGLLVPALLLGLLVSALWLEAGLWILQVCARLLDIWQRSLTLLAQQSVPLDLPPVTGSALGLALCAMALLFLPRGLGWRWLSVPLLLPWLWPSTSQPAYGTAEIIVLDVGQGLSVLVRTHEHQLLYDTGDRFASGYTVAEAVIIPFLQRHPLPNAGQGVLDRIVISHGDRDHIGGLQAMAAYDTSARIDSPMTPLSVRQSEYCIAGDSWEWDGIRFTFLGTGTVVHSECRKGRRNDSSCVLQVCSDMGEDSEQGLTQDCALLTGDISRRRERQLRERFGDLLRSRILLAPHHGSRSSSSDSFLRVVQPQWISCSAGYANRFGHPSAQALERLEQVGRVLVTAQTGTQTFTLGSDRAPILFRDGTYWWRRIRL